jgi:hypothetical protein
VYLQAKLDFLRLEPVHASRDAAVSMQLSEVVGELHSLYDHEVPAARRQRGVMHNREEAYVGGRFPVTERYIPSYDATNDRHCVTYVAGNNFKSSPFMRLKKAATRAVRYFGKGGGQLDPVTPPSPQVNNLALLSPLARPDKTSPGRVLSPTDHLEDRRDPFFHRGKSPGANAPAAAAVTGAGTSRSPGPRKRPSQEPRLDDKTLATKTMGASPGRTTKRNKLKHESTLGRSATGGKLPALVQSPGKPPSPGPGPSGQRLSVYMAEMEQQRGSSPPSRGLTPVARTGTPVTPGSPVR